jgi:hypothetical protein
MVSFSLLNASDQTTICDANFVLCGIGLSYVLHTVNGGQGLDIVMCTLDDLILDSYFSNLWQWGPWEFCSWT